MSHGNSTCDGGAVQVQTSWFLEGIRKRLESVNQFKNMRDSNRFKPGTLHSQPTRGRQERGLSRIWPVRGMYS